MIIDMTKQILATIIVFGVITLQTVLIEINYDLNPDSVIILLIGFIAADVFAAATYGMFAE